MQPEFQIIDVGGVRLRAALAGAGPLVVLAHGFPELWYSWRHQIGALAGAGYRVCAFDLRGYGGSDKPHPVKAYDLAAMTGDIAGLIAALSPERPAALVGHDWGALLAWHAAVLHPGRIRAVAGLSVPYTGLPPLPLIDLFNLAFTLRGKFFYQVYFQKPGVAEAELEADARRSLRMLYYAAGGEGGGAWSAPGKTPRGPLLEGMPDPEVFPAWMSEADLDVYAQAYRESGFRGPLNRYRTSRRDHALMRRVKDRRVRQPALFIGGDRDPVLKMFPPASPAALMARHVLDLRGAHLLPGVGHWTQQEAPEAVSRLLVDFLKALD